MIINKKEPLMLLIGDIFFFLVSLWAMLLLRYLSLPDKGLFMSHLTPFIILFLGWLFVFFIAGLYERSNTMMRRSIPTTLIKAQVVNSVMAVLFFYFIPFFGITPKTNLFIYLIISLLLLLVWRLWIFRFLAPKSKHSAMLIGRGGEMKELRDEINNGRYGYQVTHSINLDSVEGVDIQEDIVNQVYSNDISTVVIDTRDDSVIPLLPHLYNLMFSNITFIDMHEVYEQIFGRVPLSLVRHGWFLENVRSRPHIMYDTLKRIMDLIIAFVLGVVSLIVYPLIFLVIKIGDRGPLFYRDERIGKSNQKFNVLKFRSMSEDDGGEQAVTRVGKFLRNTRLDELPQLWNVVHGDISLIGPRPERPDLVSVYKDGVPYYNVRHLIKPGLSGWAQMYHDNHPHHDADVDATKEKLSYDLYYIKNRSLFLDLKIALQTIKTLLSRQGR
jgi:exopolysaccharide biosynthesis polyprenyl glycosylphosphotransferase